MAKSKLKYAVLSGCCAASGSLFGKLCGLPAFKDLLLLRASLFLLMLVCNAGVWTLFVKALQFSQSSLTATVISAASNYFISAIVGFVLFKEVTSLYWWSGMSLILAGLLLILKDQKPITVTEIKAK